MRDWNPDLYRRFEDERTRPAHDLLERVGHEAARHVVDLGCGPGNSTELLVRRYPDADVVGIDNSDEMLAAARKRLPDAKFEMHDIAAWRPVTPPDVIYANASLQWVGAHDALVPRLFAALAPGGVLAIQMPDNREEPSHRLMRDIAGREPWWGLIGETATTRVRVLQLTDYYDMLAPGAEAVDVWRTTYQHPMDSAAAIVNWVSGTGLRPFIDPLPADLRASFLKAYESAISDAYRRRADGKRLLAFPRLFVVARRKAA